MQMRDQFKARANTNILANAIHERQRNKVVKMVANAKSNYMNNEIMKSMENPKRHLKEQSPLNQTKID